MIYGRHLKLAPQYQSNEPLKIPLESVNIKNVILVGDAKAAEIFFKKIFPHYTECFVVSADGAYPEDENLRNQVLQELATNRSVAVVIFGADAYRKVQILSERILVMDRIVADCFSKAKIKSMFKAGMNEFDIVHLLTSFFDQWRVVHRSGNFAHQIRTSEEYDREKMSWLLDLIAPESGIEEPPVQVYQVEDHEGLIFAPKDEGQKEQT